MWVLSIDPPFNLHVGLLASQGTAHRAFLPLDRRDHLMITPFAIPKTVYWMNTSLNRHTHHHNLGKPRVLSRLQVGFLSARHRCGIPTPFRTSYNSCEFTWALSFHVAREATLVLRESCCCQVLSATVYARYPRAYHHSSSLTS
jgi:hypothetical protein